MLCQLDSFLTSEMKSRRFEMNVEIDVPPSAVAARLYARLVPTPSGARRPKNRSICSEIQPSCEDPGSRDDDDIPVLPPWSYAQNCCKWELTPGTALISRSHRPVEPLPPPLSERHIRQVPLSTTQKCLNCGSRPCDPDVLEPALRPLSPGTMIRRPQRLRGRRENRQEGYLYEGVRRR